jgi:hypothetical protein
MAIASICGRRLRRYKRLPLLVFSVAPLLGSHSRRLWLPPEARVHWREAFKQSTRSAQALAAAAATAQER